MHDLTQSFTPGNEFDLPLRLIERRESIESHRRAHAELPPRPERTMTRTGTASSASRAADAASLTTTDLISNLARIRIKDKDVGATTRT
ncbi:hypothetical protein GCM10022383_21660 [Microbacterium soli]|uniref:Uncharacterized protein n=1 Tax=Microbacterium soli TaxID=446075 RepID=A0ABP7ND96_9MICO